MWVMPSSSARCAQLPRAADKVPFYAALKKFRDYLNGLVPELDEKEIVFTYSKLKNFFEPDVKEESKDVGGYGGYNGRTGDGLTDMTSSVIKKENSDDQSNGPPKKKRGRPKKIKVEGEAPPEKKEKPPKETYDKDGNLVPKKKRGRPKKIKPELTSTSNSTAEQKQPQTQGNSSTPTSTSSQAASHTPTPSNTCFSPPTQSPINLCQQGFSQIYNNQSQAYNQSSSQSPLSSHNNFHQSPMQSHGYNQSPQPPSFTHSDLSSEISAAISSEQNIASRSPNSSSLGATPEFEQAPNTQEENSKSSLDIKEENPDHMECHFSSPSQSKKKSPDVNYQNYDEYSGDSETNTSSRYPQRPPSGFAPKPVANQDVASKSLSGLESLVDQIPNIGDGEVPHTVVSGEVMDSAPSSAQYSDDSAYLSDYPRVSHYSPQYPATVPTTSNSYTSPSPSMNFSVTSLANSSATTSNETYSVSSLASNYPSSSYTNLMGPPPTHPMIDSFGGTCRIGSPMEPMSGVNMPGSGLPYPYNQYSSPYPGGPPAGFPYSPSHNIHVPSPNFPYPSPYSNSGYPQSSYLQSHVFDRLKNERMDIGFGGF